MLPLELAPRNSSYNHSPIPCNPNFRFCPLFLPLLFLLLFYFSRTSISSLCSPGSFGIGSALECDPPMKGHTIRKKTGSHSPSIFQTAPWGRNFVSTFPVLCRNFVGLVLAWYLNILSKSRRFLMCSCPVVWIVSLMLLPTSNSSSTSASSTTSETRRIKDYMLIPR